MIKYIYEVEGAPDEEVTAFAIQCIADDLADDGWEFMGFYHGKIIKRKGGVNERIAKLDARLDDISEIARSSYNR